MSHSRITYPIISRRYNTYPYTEKRAEANWRSNPHRCQNKTTLSLEGTWGLRNYQRVNEIDWLPRMWDKIQTRNDLRYKWIT